MEKVLEKIYEFGYKFKEKIGQFLGADKSLSVENVALQARIKELEIRQAQIEEERKAELRELRRQHENEKIGQRCEMNKRNDVEKIMNEEGFKFGSKESSAIEHLVDLYGEFKTDDPSYRWEPDHKEEIKQRGDLINSIISNASPENKEKLQKYVTNLVNKGIGLYSDTNTYANIKNGEIEKMQIGKVEDKKFTGILIENNQAHYFINSEQVNEKQLQNTQIGAKALKVFDNIAYINENGQAKLYGYVQHHLKFKNGNFEGNLYGNLESREIEDRYIELSKLIKIDDSIENMNDSERKDMLTKLAYNKIDVDLV